MTTNKKDKVLKLLLNHMNNSKEDQISNIRSIKGIIKITNWIDTFEILKNENLITYDLINKEPFFTKITPQGKIYFSNKKQEKFRFWFPVIISALSLLVSVGAFILSIIALLKLQQMP